MLLVFCLYQYVSETYQCAWLFEASSSHIGRDFLGEDCKASTLSPLSLGLYPWHGVL